MNFGVDLPGESFLLLRRRRPSRSLDRSSSKKVKEETFISPEEVKPLLLLLPSLRLTGEREGDIYFWLMAAAAAASASERYGKEAEEEKLNNDSKIDFWQPDIWLMSFSFSFGESTK